ncbi:MAG: bifunctional phosphoribosyl-AMP cyclohydrolase/phosphoribosyl-ATP diphosphatase HisIE [Bacteroidota bacterium]|nr:bifunctional phosphoribosyl-AMP cyclohydrolase/phosphoribosyl-ATP diphosphatase HisIE [Bacteroidota bacterium]
MNSETITIDFLQSVDFSKTPDNLVPVIVQDHTTDKVLMLGFMNEGALKQTIETRLVTFFSRSKQRLWVKGETSKNYLHVIDIKIDCDKDTILIKAKPDGPVCHTGTDTCFKESNSKEDFLDILEKIIVARKQNPDEKSYTSSLFTKGINAIAQKVGEEAIELVIEAKDDNADLFLNEAADLLFHYMILLQAKEKTLADVVKILKNRHKNN